MKDLIHTDMKISLSLMRIAIGWILIVEGSGKLWGWFDGTGLTAAQQFYTGIGVPFGPHHASIIGWGERLSGGFLFVGFLTRLAAIPALIRMGGALYMIGTLSGSVHHLHLMAFLMCMVLLELGAGPLSIDAFLTKRREK